MNSISFTDFKDMEKELGIFMNFISNLLTNFFRYSNDQS